MLIIFAERPFDSYKVLRKIWRRASAYKRETFTKKFYMLKSIYVGP